MYTWLSKVAAVAGEDFRQERVPNIRTCYVSAVPEPPGVIESDSIVIHEFQVNNRLLFMNLSWEEPNTTHGSILRYEVRVTRQPLSQLDDDASMIFAVAYKGTLLVSCPPPSRKWHIHSRCCDIESLVCMLTACIINMHL